MQIDWFTTAAQLVNFFVLVWLLRRFLYRPVVAAIARRQQAIADEFATAEAATAAAEATKADFKARAAALAQEAEAVRAQALADIEVEKQELLAAAAAEAEAARIATKSELAADRDSFLAHMRLDASQAVIDVSRDVFADLADERIEAALARRLAGELGSHGETFAAAIARTEGPLRATLSARSPVPEPDLATLRAALEAMCGRPVAISMLDRADGPVGVVLEMGELRAEWSIDAHMDALVSRLGDRLDKRLADGPGGASSP